MNTAFFLFSHCRAFFFGLLVAAAALVLPLSQALAQEVDLTTSAQQVNINTADATVLAAGLKGVGRARAAEIVRYRETFGPFASPDELMEVKGIGRSTLELNRERITLE